MYYFLFGYRGGKEIELRGAGPLPGRSVAVADDRDSLHHEAPGAVDDRGLQAGEGGPLHHLPEPQLHGPTPGAGAVPEEQQRDQTHLAAAGHCPRRALWLLCLSSYSISFIICVYFLIDFFF